jgi:hypothetical protein
LRAFAEEVDATGGAVARDALLHGVGERMAMMSPLPAVVDIAGIEIEINSLLAEWGWGSAELELNETEHALVIVHHGLPSVGSIGDPPGTWLSALLEGLYETWIGQIPGGDRGLSARRQRILNGAVTLRYGRNA